MAIYHLSSKPVSRGAGRSATAAAAYRAGERVVDHQTGEVHDYRRRSGVEWTETTGPDGEPVDRERLWNLAEAAERRKDARVAREYEVALPDELTPDQRRELVRDFTQHLRAEYGVATDAAIHAPDVKGDQRNWHAHILCTTRQVERQGDDIKLEAKARSELDDKTLKARGEASTKEQLKMVRARWALCVNNALERHGHAARVDHRTLEAQGIKRAAQTHDGPAITEMKRRGAESRVASERAAEQRRRVAESRYMAEQRLPKLQDERKDVEAALQAQISAAKAEAQARDENARVERVEAEKPGFMGALTGATRKHQEELAKAKEAARRAVERAKAEAADADLASRALAAADERRAAPPPAPAKAEAKREDYTKMPPTMKRAQAQRAPETPELIKRALAEAKTQRVERSPTLQGALARSEGGRELVELAQRRAAEIGVQQTPEQVQAEREQQAAAERRRQVLAEIRAEMHRPTQTSALNAEQRHRALVESARGKRAHEMTSAERAAVAAEHQRDAQRIADTLAPRPQRTPGQGMGR